RHEEPVPAPAAFASPAKQKAPAQKVVAVSAPSPAPTTPSPAAPAAGKRYFEVVQGTSSKVWEGWVSGREMTTRWGRIGSAGQSKAKTFVDEAEARAEAAKLIAEKTEKGYVEK